MMKFYNQLRGLSNEEVRISFYRLQRWHELAALRREISEIGFRDDSLENSGRLAVCKEILSEMRKGPMNTLLEGKALKRWSSGMHMNQC